MSKHITVIDERHEEAHALLSKVMEDVGHLVPYRAVVEWWLERHSPKPPTCGALAPNIIPAHMCEREPGHTGAHRAAGVWFLRDAREVAA